MRRIQLWILLLLSVSVLPQVSSAQPAALDREHKASCLLEIVHPELVEIHYQFSPFVFDYSAATGVLVIAGRYRVWNSFAAVVDAEFGRYAWTSSGSDSVLVRTDSTGGIYEVHTLGDGSASIVANPYFGFEILGSHTPWSFEAGVRPNVGPVGGGTFVGASSDLARWEPFVAAWSLRFGVRVHTDRSRTTFGTFQGGTTLYFSGSDDAGELWGGATGTHRFGKWFVDPAFEGRVQLQDVAYDRFLGQVEFAGGYEGGHTRPEGFIRVYLNKDWRDVVSWSAGIRCGGF